jgi:hypothetical protein
MEIYALSKSWVLLLPFKNYYLEKKIIICLSKKTRVSIEVDVSSLNHVANK